MRGVIPTIAMLSLLGMAGSPAIAATPATSSTSTPAQVQSLLSDPGNYSLDTPSSTSPDARLLPGASPPLVAGGYVSQSFGSGGLRSSTVQLNSGLLGGSTRAFLQLGTGQGPQFHGRPVVQGSSVALGVESEIARGVTVGFGVGYERDRFGYGGSRWGGSPGLLAGSSLP